MIRSRSYRTMAMGRAAVASNHPAATQAGLEVLRAGGNAADAAVCVSLCLGVAEPFMSGLGGDGFYQVFDGQPWVYEGVGAAPAAATADAYGAAGLPYSGARAISPPGSLAGLLAMHTAHGRMPLAQLCAPAMALCLHGVPASHTYRRYAASERARFEASATAAFLVEGEPPQLGHRIRNSRLADTLEAIARGGAEAFYRGDIGQRIAHDIQAAGGLVDARDLAATVAVRREPLRTHYRGFEILQTPPLSSGFVLQQELALLERFDLDMLRQDTAALVHHMVEIKKQAFLDRERFAGDPRFGVPDCMQALQPEHIAELAAEIDPQRAAHRPLRTAQHEGDTTYFCVVDRDGRAVSAIQSLNAAFGCGVVLPGTGIAMNNRMTTWHLDAAHPNCLMPGKKVRHTMNAPIVLRDGRVWAVLGTPGADNQVQVNFQAIVGLIDLGWDPQQVVEAPRWSSDQFGQDANWPHRGGNRLTVESDMPAEVLDGLRAYGHDLNVVPPLEGPCSLEIIRVLDDGTKLAGSDPRRDGWAMALD